jgi:predicted homoserine dehydrogenase-like protein
LTDRGELRHRGRIDAVIEWASFAAVLVLAHDACRGPSAGRYLPEGLVQGCLLRRRIAKDAVITYDDVVLPAGRLADRLRAEQYRKFRGETWLKDLLTAPQIAEQARQAAVSVDS